MVLFLKNQIILILIIELILDGLLLCYWLIMVLFLVKNGNINLIFKMKIIKLVFERKSKTSLVAEYNITGSAGTIVAWMHKYEELGYNGLISKRKGRPKKYESEIRRA